MYDLLVRNAVLIDPAQKIHARQDVAFAQGRVAALADHIPSQEARDVIHASGFILTPGWIDLHVHVFEGISHYGIHADAHCIAKGVTTAVDAGSAGADTFVGFRKYVIEASATRLFAQLNISSQGMLSQEVGELDDIRWADVNKALKMIEANRDVILGVKVRLERDFVCSAASGIRPLYLAREAADAAGLPIMIHPQKAWASSLDDILTVMKAGDIVTHCFHGFDICGILDARGRVRESVLAAAARGVIFDVGHGRGSFSWQVVESALQQGFLPQTISSDLHRHNIHGPVYDLATTASKFLYLGLSLDEVIARVTATPAQAIQHVAKDIGSLRVGAWGDATIWLLDRGNYTLQDSQGAVRNGTQQLMPVKVIKDGKVVGK